MPQAVRKLSLGDVSRSINIQDKRETARIWRENYMYECDRLAQQLYVPNYRDPVAARYGLRGLAVNLSKRFLDLLTYHDLTVYISKQIGAKVELNIA